MVGKNITISISGKNLRGSKSFSSSNTKVATVNSSGKVVAKSPGTATISVYVKATGNYTESNKKTCKITVKKAAAKKVAVKSVKLNKKTASIKKGKKVTLKTMINPSNATNKTVTWKTSNKKVATVTSKGVIKGVKKGKATITVVTKDGNRKAICKVTVK